MSDKRTSLRQFAWLFIVVLLLTGCGAGPSTPSRFYVLSSPGDLLAAKRPAIGAQSLQLGVGPISLPPHLDRTQIVTQASRHRLDLKDLDQWAEPLKDGFTRVLAQNLSALLETDNVFQYPWRRPFTVDYQVTVEVIRFDTDPTGESVLAARWNVVNGDGRELLFSHTSTFKTRVADKGIEPTVAAMSRNLAELSREISTSVAALTK